jgi:hypothetical protein
VRGFLDTYCVTCHNDRLQTGGLSVTTLDATDASRHPELWEKILHKLTTGQMPPAGRTQPDAATRAALVRWLEDGLDRAASRHPDPGRVGLHRLNRAEYANAVRDLLGVEIDVKNLLLPDESDEGFDNVAASLALSPSHLERYLAAARAISRLAVGDEPLRLAPVSALYKNPKLLEQDVRTSEDLPFGSRGGLAVRHHFPLAGEYTFKVRLRRQIYDYILGMGNPQQLEIRIDGTRIKRFRVGGEGKGVAGPLTWHGELVGETEWELYMHAADAGLEVRAPVTAGVHVVSAAFVADPWEPEGVQQPLPVDFARGSDEQYDGYAGVDALAITGPVASAHAPTPSSRGAWRDGCTPRRMDRDAAAEDRLCASRQLSTLAQRAYRRPATADEIATLLTFYDAASKERGFTGGLQAAIERLLVSFNFLTRVEHDPPNAAAGSVYQLSDLDLA